MLRSNAMTIGQLSRRTGVPIKVLRHYEDLGFLYTRGRSESNYRLFGEEAVWCVQVIGGLRSLGLTLKEIRALVRCYLERPGGLCCKDDSDMVSSAPIQEQQRSFLHEQPESIQMASFRV